MEAAREPALKCATVLTFVFSMDDGSGSQGNNDSRLRKKENLVKFWKKILPCFPKTNLTAQSLKSPIMNGKVAPQQDVSIKQSHFGVFQNMYTYDTD